jgi:hypothetical protein
MTDPVVDEKVVKGRIMELMRVSMEKLDAHNRRAFAITQEPGRW